MTDDDRPTMRLPPPVVFGALVIFGLVCWAAILSLLVTP